MQFLILLIFLLFLVLVFIYILKNKKNKITKGGLELTKKIIWISDINAKHAKNICENILKKIKSNKKNKIKLMHNPRKIQNKDFENCKILLVSSSLSTGCNGFARKLNPAIYTHYHHAWIDEDNYEDFANLAIKKQEILQHADESWENYWNSLGTCRIDFIKQSDNQIMENARDLITEFL